jgi:hypothetical protein
MAWALLWLALSARLHRNAKTQILARAKRDHEELSARATPARFANAWARVERFVLQAAYHCRCESVCLAIAEHHG